MRPIVKRAIFSAVLVACLRPPASLALDCTKANAPIDKAICSNAPLKAQDAELSALYFATLRKLLGPQHDLLIEDQRIWLKTRDETCGSQAGDLDTCVRRSMSERKTQITACFSGATPDASAKSVTCLVAARRSCPEYTLSASPALSAFPFLRERLKTIEARKRRDADKDACAPEDKDHYGSPEGTQDDTTLSVVGSGPGWIAVKQEDDGMARGAPHPFHDESVTTYNTDTGQKLPIEKIMPDLKTRPKESHRLWDAANEHLSVPCCGHEDDGSKLDDLGILHSEADKEARPLPDGWSVDADGSLRVFYGYLELGRGFVAEAPIPREIFIGWVAEKYRPFFARGGK